MLVNLVLYAANVGNLIAKCRINNYAYVIGRGSIAMNDWAALAGRITIFPNSQSTGVLPSALELYKKIWPSDPDNFQSPNSPLSPSVAQGRHAGLSVSCTVHPTRIDLTLTPPLPTLNAANQQFPLIENSSEFHSELVRIAKLIGTGLLSNPVLRVATFLQFVSIEANSTEANKALMSIVPSQYRLKLGDEVEFIMQVNRPRLSDRVENLKMNLITKWNVDHFQMFAIMRFASGPPVVAMPAQDSSRLIDVLAASVSFDNNNEAVPAEKPLSASDQSSLILEGFTRTSESLQESGISIEGFENG